jgi:hypothetical protein
MPPPERKRALSVRLSRDEWEICEKLSLRKGIDNTAVLRQGMMEWAAREGIELPDKKRKASPGGSKSG